MNNTKIEWTDHTFNPWWGCTNISPACDNCYAQALDKRTGGDHWGVGKPRKRTSAKNWQEPLKWDKQADAFMAKNGRRQRVFCASMADVFDNEVSSEWRSDIFALISLTQNLDWLLLTKRIGNARAMLQLDNKLTKHEWGDGWPNVWIGATICNQEEADRDIPKLLAVPAAKRFLSIEPLLGPVNLRQVEHGARWLDVLAGGGFHETHFEALPKDHHPTIDWVICGGESGHKARPMHPDWPRSLRDQCAAAGTPFFFKQWGEWHPKIWSEGGDVVIGADVRVMTEIEGREMVRIGKKAAGRLLDGVVHDGVPA